MTRCCYGSVWVSLSRFTDVNGDQNAVARRRTFHGSIGRRRGITIFAVLAGFVTAVLPSVLLAPARAATSSAVFDAAGCRTNSLAPNDDLSTDAVRLPFSFNYFGRTYSNLFVNNNGNITFTAPQSEFTPYTIDASTPPIIAPFFADVDTRGGLGSVTYGNTTFQGFPAFCVDWTNVGYFSEHPDLRDTFQLLLVSRPDIGGDAFDIVFNYGQLQWETGDASGGSGGMGGESAGAGFSNGDGQAQHFYQLPGSLTNGAFLDRSPSGLVHGSANSDVVGRYIFHVRTTGGDPNGDISGLARDFASNATGYKFTNPRLRTDWLHTTGLSVGDVLTHGDMTRVFSDWNSVTQGQFLWWTYGRDGHFFDALADAMNNGMCFGMALTGGRFNAGLESLRNASARRSDPLWAKANSYQLLAPGEHGTSSTYNKELIRMVADSFVTQYSTQVHATLQRQHDAYADPTSGFASFKSQLLSVLRNGKNLYDPSGKTNTATGNKYAGITLQVDGFGGHEVLAYSLRVQDDGSLDIGVWDSNFPNQPKKITVHPDGSWSYNATYGSGSIFPRKTLSMRGDTSYQQGWLSVLPLFGDAGFNFYPTDLGANAALGSGSLVDVPAGVVARATDDSGRPVGSELVIANGGVDAGSVLNLTSGSGVISVSGGGQPALTIRGDGGFMAAESTSAQPVTVSTTDGQAALAVTSGSADLHVAAGPTVASTTGTSALTVAPSGGVSATGAGVSAQIQVTQAVNGEPVTAVLYSGQLPSGGHVTFTPATVKQAVLSAAAPPPAPPVTPPVVQPSLRDQQLSVRAPKKVAQSHVVTIRGTVDTSGGTVGLYTRMLKHGRTSWAKVATARVEKGKFSFSLAHLAPGTHIYQVRRDALPGYNPAVSGMLKVVVRPTQS